MNVNGRSIQVFPDYQLISWDIVTKIIERPDIQEDEINIPDPLLIESYETFLKRLYGIPIQLPEFLIINGLRVNFIPFQQIVQMLAQNQIERYDIDPLLQPWSDSSNKIITMFGRNGMTYLVKAQYDGKTNQIFPPV